MFLRRNKSSEKVGGKLKLVYLDLGSDRNSQIEDGKLVVYIHVYDEHGQVGKDNVFVKDVFKPELVEGKCTHEYTLEPPTRVKFTCELTEPVIIAEIRERELRRYRKGYYEQKELAVSFRVYIKKELGNQLTANVLSRFENYFIPRYELMAREKGFRIVFGELKIVYV